jgi:branched-chain amino acid transport system substrate-binding protein
MTNKICDSEDFIMQGCNKSFVGSLLAAGSLVMALTLAGGAAMAEPGVSPTEIVVGMWAAMTGSTALIGTSERDGILIGINEVNAAGGIKGRKLRLIAYDDAGTPQEALSGVRRLIDQDQVFALLAGSNAGATLPVMPLINRAKIPFLASVAAHRNLFVPFAPTAFRIYANEVVQAQRIVDYSVKEVHVQRPAIIYTSNDYGVGGVETVTAELKKANIALVASERYNQGDQDFSAQLLRIREAKPDALYVWSFAAEAGIIVRQAKELGLEAKMFGGGGTTTPLFPKGAGPAGVGFVAPWVFPYTEDDATAAPVAHYRDLLTKHYPNGLPAARPSLYDLAGYGVFKVFAEALRRIEGEPTRAALVKALDSMKDYDPGVLFPITFTPTDHEGSKQATVIAVDQSLTWKIVK